MASRENWTVFLMGLTDEQREWLATTLNGRLYACCVRRGHAGRISELVAQGASVNCRLGDRKKADTPLIAAAEHENLPAIKELLLIPDINISLKGSEGMTALTVALSNNSHRCSDLLKAARAHRRKLSGNSPSGSAQSVFKFPTFKPEDAPPPSCIISAPVAAAGPAPEAAAVPTAISTEPAFPFAFAPSLLGNTFGVVTPSLAASAASVGSPMHAFLKATTPSALAHNSSSPVSAAVNPFLPPAPSEVSRPARPITAPPPVAIAPLPPVEPAALATAGREELSMRLGAAIKDNNWALARDCLALGADPCFCPEGEGYTCLISAAMNGAATIVRYMLEMPHIQLDDRDCNGMTAVEWACVTGHIDVAELLLAAGAKPPAPAFRMFEDQSASDDDTDDDGASVGATSAHESMEDSSASEYDEEADIDVLSSAPAPSLALAPAPAAPHSGGSTPDFRR